MKHSAKDVPESVLEAFPVLSDATFVRRLASPVPLVPDTTFDIYMTSNQDFLALVATDYTDPGYQSHELKSISGQYEFEFKNLVKPYGHDDETIKVLENDDMDVDYFVGVPYKTYELCYYVANLEYNN